MRSRFLYLAAITAVGCAIGLLLAPGGLDEVVAQEQKPADRSAAPVTEVDRSVLPVKEPEVAAITELDARNAKAPPRFEVKAPAGAPNVVIVLIDDMGFGQCSAFGGPLHMPTAERLASQGLRYNRFHTTALCSPTRAALLTGRNHHSNNMGGITEIATAFPGNTGQRPQNIAPLAETLRLNGFNTAAFGKSHETAAWEVSVSGPFDRWPTRSGFEKFYGFIGGETNQWNPLIYEGTTKVEPPADPNYHFMTDMTNQAITWMQAQQSLTPEKPFFLYFAPGATHAPHHAPKEWAARYEGKFSHGWDKQRELTLAKQIELGVVPKGTRLAPKPPGIKDWDTLSDTEKKVFARQMEVFAGYGEYCDHEIGRLVSAIEETGELDNTLFLYIVGDNGASAEGGLTGLFNEITFFNGVNESIETVEKRLDELGGPTTFNHYAAGWAVAGDAPFTWTKQMAADFGGTRNALIVHWPKGIKARGEVRSQFHHVIDIAPTVLDACRLPEPKEVNGITQRPIEGVSMSYSFDDPTTKDRRKTQYFEIAANRAIYHDGWVAMTVHRVPWEFKPLTTLENDQWKLFHVEEDFSEAVDLAEKHPEKVKELQEVFLKEAIKYHVLPIDDRSVERFNAELAGRPELIGDRKSLTLNAGAPGMMENAFINTKNRSHSITATVELPKDAANGVILCQGGRFAGWSFYFKDGKPCYAYNWFGLETYKVVAERPLPPGPATIRYAFTFDGGMPGSGGVGTIFVNDAKVAEGKIDKTVANTISLDETADIGEDTATVVTDDYKEHDNKFTGKIGKVTIELNIAKNAQRN
jgi:arylsulfatase A-like enzyme